MADEIQHAKKKSLNLAAEMLSMFGIYQKKNNEEHIWMPAKIKRNMAENYSVVLGSEFLKVENLSCEIMCDCRRSSPSGIEEEFFCAIKLTAICSQHKQIANSWSQRVSSLSTDDEHFLVLRFVYTPTRRLCKWYRKYKNASGDDHFCSTSISLCNWMIYPT